MSVEQTRRAIAGRLSLRAPQSESLSRLAEALEAVPALRNPHARGPTDLAAMVEALRGTFPHLSDFERDFPSLCFALATGVGKTRLMGAFIAYLHAAYGYRHFFVLAPNLTIYEKLIRDFTPNTPKYVFKGVAEFAGAAPEVITGDTYEQRADLRSGSLFAPIQINIFNISKINTEVRGGRAPRIKRLSEYLGQSYFDYLAELPELVLLMDESHRYRASAGIRVLNELKPLLGLELTATPFTEAGANKPPIPFKNVVMEYPLARAIEDGFVKEPAVVTQQNFDASAHSSEEIERIKLLDGLRVHEETKVHLLTYARSQGERTVKPFMLVIARDTTHAATLMRLISTEFFDERYAGKVIQVDSGTTSGAEGDDVVRRLLAVESYEEPTEIVIHVNMLKEGWDVTNLYTIVPLRAANARTLIEQSIGRGLRLPYGRKTGVEPVDRLNIIAHDRFQDVINEAGRGDSPIRMKTLVLDAPGEAEAIRNVPLTPTLNALLGLGAGGEVVIRRPDDIAPGDAMAPAQAAIAKVTLDVINEMTRGHATGEAAMPRVTSSAALSDPALQQEIATRVAARITPAQAELLPPDGPSVLGLVQRTAGLLAEHNIDIPRIQVKPKAGAGGHYAPFKLDISALHLQPVDQQLVSHGLQSGKEVLYGEASTVPEARPADYIVRNLIDYDDVAYDEQAEFIYDLATQAVDYLKSYLDTDSALHNVLANQGRLIAEHVHAQMLAYWQDDPSESEVIVSQGFTALKPGAVTAAGRVYGLMETPPDLSKIATLVFGGFAKCAYDLQKFHSGTERLLAIILEREARRWFRPQRGQMNIFYRQGVYEAEYVPDFVAATREYNWLLETKRVSDMATEEVQAKARAGALWCTHASNYSVRHGGLPWRYLLIPHDAVAVNATLSGLARYEW
ncbi:MAG: DEAD/DEAH box helicase family protein [Proteobacteria bacterium]|nr:DEAD/DEAH box helicase family protein [Pseudomonadota bacterium]